MSSVARPLEISDEEVFWTRCQYDRWFAGEHLARVVDQMSPDPTPKPLIPRPEQRVLWDLIDLRRSQGRRQDVIMLKARAVGGSLGTMWGYYHDALFTSHLRLLTTAHLDASVLPLQEYATGFIMLNDDLPADLKDELGIRLQGDVFRFTNGSRWRFGTARSPDQFKSDRATRALLTEMASYGAGSEDMERRLYEALDGAIPSHSNVTVVRESTSSGPRGRFYHMFKDAFDGVSDIDWLFFSFGSSPLYAFDCTKKELELDAQLKAAWASRNTDAYHRAISDLGYTEQWAELAVQYQLTPGQVRWGMAKCRTEYQNDMQLFLRNYPITPMSAFDSTQRHFFPMEVIKAWREMQPPAETVVGKRLFLDTTKADGADVRIETGTDYWRIFRKPREGYSYILGVDIAQGNGGDYSCIQVFCRNTREQVAEFYCNRIDPRDLAVQVAYASTYFNKARIVVENTDIGVSTIDKLLQMNLHGRMYRNAEIPREVANPINWTKAYGYPNRSKGARTQLLTTLRLESIGGMAVYSTRLLHESNTFVETSENHWDHQKNCNSDAIIALALAVWDHSQQPSVMFKHSPDLPALRPENFNPVAYAAEAHRMKRDLTPRLPGSNALVKRGRVVPRYK